MFHVTTEAQINVSCYHRGPNKCFMLPQRPKQMLHVTATKSDTSYQKIKHLANIYIYKLQTKEP
jgi:hypothetical protein